MNKDSLGRDGGDTTAERWEGSRGIGGVAMEHEHLDKRLQLAPPNSEKIIARNNKVEWW